MLAFAFQAAGFASYLALRERHLNSAVLLSQTFVVLSGLTHPNGGMLSFIGQLVLALYLDRTRLRPIHAALAAIPYVTGAIGWGIYIAQDPQAFLAQYGFQTKDRLDGFLHPWRAIRREFVQRYIPQMGLGAHFTRNVGPHFLKSLIFLSYAVAIGGALLIRELREQRAVRILLGLAVLFLIFYTFLEQTKAQYYLVYLTTIYTGLLALFICFLWERRWLPKPLIALGVALLLVVQAGGSLLRMRLNAWGEYQTMVNWLNTHTQRADLIAGSHELGFLIGYTSRFVDDYEFGLHSGRQPDFIVMEEIYDDRIQMVQQKDPAEHLRLQQRLSQYRQVFRRGNYRVLMRKDHPPAA